MTSPLFTVSVDQENPAEAWWDALRAQEPGLAARLESSDEIKVTASELSRLESLPGWNSGPGYARTALIVRPALATSSERTNVAWWAWHDQDQARWSTDTATAEHRCAAWVSGESDDGPTL